MKRSRMFIISSIFIPILLSLGLISLVLFNANKANGLVLNIHNESNELIEHIDIYLYNSETKTMIYQVNNFENSDIVNEVIAIKNYPKSDYALGIDFLVNNIYSENIIQYLPSITGRYEMDIIIQKIDSDIVAKIKYTDSFVENSKDLVISYPSTE